MDERKFKAGDEVIIEGSGNLYSITKDGSIGVIIDELHSGVTASTVSFSKLTGPAALSEPNAYKTYMYTIPNKYLKHNKQPKETKMKKEGYAFTISAPYLIDWEKIAPDCTKENPLILIEAELEQTQKQLDDRQTVKELKAQLMATQKKAKQLRENELIFEEDDLTLEIESLELILAEAESSLRNSLSENKQVFLMIHNSMLYKHNIVFGDNSDFDNAIQVSRTYDTTILKVDYKRLSELKAVVQKTINASWPNPVKTEVKVKSLL